MKTKIFKIIIILAVSLFLSASVSLAHDKKGKQNKSHAKAYSYHKDHKGNGHHPNWHKKYYKSFRHRPTPYDHYHRQYYQKRHRHHPKWHRNHYKSYPHRNRPKHRYHKRYDHYELHGRHHNKRNLHGDGFVFGISLNDPHMAVVIGAKGN